MGSGRAAHHIDFVRVDVYKRQAGEYGGTALGIDSQGALLVQCSEGEVRSVISGEVSVRGIYGYV